MPTCSPWTWPCLCYARVPGVAPGCLNTLFPSVAWKVKGRDVQVHGHYPHRTLHMHPSLTLLLSTLSLSLLAWHVCCIHLPICCRRNTVQCKDNATPYFKLSHHLSSSQLSEQFCAFSTMREGREGKDEGSCPACLFWFSSISSFYQRNVCICTMKKGEIKRRAAHL